jgi:hypothetical protein
VAPGIHHLTLRQGEGTVILAAQWLRGGAPVDLDTVTMRAQIRRTYGDPEVLLDFNVEAGTLIKTDAANGRFELHATAGQREDIDVDISVYDVLVFIAGVPERLLQGTVTLSRSVTRIED